MKFDPHTNVPKPQKSWTDEPKLSRLKKINNFIDTKNYNKVKIIDINDTTGELLLNIIEQIDTKDRLTYLLNLEEELKTNFDSSLYIMIEPMGDKNSLRKLRGITIKKGYED